MDEPASHWQARLAELAAAARVPGASLGIWEAASRFMRPRVIRTIGSGCLSTLQQ